MIFHDVTAEDGLWARPLLEQTYHRSCEFAFANIFMWSGVYNTKITRFENFCIVRSESRRMHYLFPSGNGDIKKAIDEILLDAQQNKKEAVIFSLQKEHVEILKNIYPNKFDYALGRGDSDYFYLSTDLAQLPGKKFQKKRGHCSRFERQYPNWKFHEITKNSMLDVCSFNNRWCNLYDNRGDEGIEQEHKAIKLVCENYDKLNLKGGYIEINGDIVAFSFGSPLGNNIFVTHVEKALYDITGAYNIINREMARHFCNGFTYINRENDVDEDGLRTAKLSYNPVFLEDKYTAVLVTN